MKSDETVTRGDLPTCQRACNCRLVMRRLRLWTVETTRSKYPTLVVSAGVVVGFYLVFGMSNVTTVTNKLRHVEACIRYSLDSLTQWAATALTNPDTSLRLGDLVFQLKLMDCIIGAPLKSGKKNLQSITFSWMNCFVPQVICSRHLW